MRAVLFGGDAHDGSYCGFVSSSSFRAPSSTTAAIGSRLCYFDAWKDVVYEEHEWLKTTLNSQGTYMTLPVNSDNLSFKRIISSVTNSSWMVTNGFSYFSYSTTGDNPLAISCWDSNQLKSILWLYKKFDKEIEVVSTSNSLTFGGTSAGQYGYPIVNVLFSNSLNGTSEYKTSSIYVDGVERYIPCRLLRPIPAALDANSIARDAGECGMWDKVGNKFYGNVASTGRFTVEGQRLYEEFDWLIGDGTAYIDTNKTLEETDVITTKFVLIDLPSNSYYLIYGNHSGSFKSFACIQFRNLGLSMSPTATDSRYSANYQLNSEISISHSVTEILINGTSVWQGASVFSENRFKCYLFATGTDVDHCFNGKVGYFNISDNLNLTPVRLLRPLPAYMDANGKPRAAGECGMWDKVSNKFYGNVASSGRFTVLNN